MNTTHTQRRYQFNFYFALKNHMDQLDEYDQEKDETRILGQKEKK